MRTSIDAGRDPALRWVSRDQAFADHPLDWNADMRMQKLYEVLKSFHERLRVALDGKKIWKDELRKVGLVLIGLGLTGPLINGKAGMWPLLVVGVVFEALGLMEDAEQEEEDV